MTREHVTAVLAERVMGWRAGPDRFLMGQRRWIPRWRFQPTEKLTDALRLLEKASPEDYSMRRDSHGTFWVRVRVNGATGKASGVSHPCTITCALARALGIEMDL